MKIRNSKKIWAGALCMTLVFANVLPAGLTASASEEQIPFETELQTNEENSEETAETDKSEEVLATEQPEETAISDTESAILEEESFEGTNKSETWEESKLDKSSKDTQEQISTEILELEKNSTNNSTEEYEIKETDNNSFTEVETKELLETEENIASGEYKDENGSNITWVIDSAGTLYVEGTGEFSKGINENRAPWTRGYQNSIYSAKVSVSGMTDASYMFYGCRYLRNVDFSGCNTGSVTNMAGMFSFCHNLETLNLSTFDTSNVTNMEGMFAYSENLISIDLNSFRTDNVTNMKNMFLGCKKLTNLNLDHFNTLNVIDMSHMFQGCNSLVNLDLSNFNTSNVTDMSLMFQHCISLKTLNLIGFSTSKVENMSSMFSACSSLENLDLSNCDASNVTNMTNMFQDCSNLKNLNMHDFVTQKITNTYAMFSKCNRLQSLDLNGFNTIHVTDMGYMFFNCESLTGLNLSSFNVSNVTNMNHMFSSCSSLTDLDLSNFFSKEITNMDNMFWNCNKLSTLDLSGFDTVNVTEIGQLIARCDSLTTFHTPLNFKHSVSLPTTIGDTWYLSDGTVVTELPKNLSYSVELIKKHSDEQDPDDDSDELKYVKSLTQNSLKNADDNTKKSINNALYNLIFKAEYRPIRSKISGDTMTFTGTKETIMKWPIQNKDAFQSSVHDAILGDIKFSNSAAGCMAYTYFASSYIYTTCGSSKKYTNLNAESIKAKIHEYADPGEQIRYHTSSYPHSVVFVGESEDGEGFYYISYGGGEDKEHHKSHDLCMDYTSYHDLAALIGGRQFLIYDTNTGSYYNGNAKPLESVHTTNAQKIIKRIACPVEATVTRDGITLDSRHPGSVSFGTVERDGEDIVFTLDYSTDYELSITGTGEGTMTLTLEYYDNSNTMIDQRKFVDVPIKASTEIKASGSDSRANYILYIPDETGNTIAWGAGINETVNAPDDIFLSNDLSMPDESESAVFTINFDTNGGTTDTTSMTTKTDGTLSELPSAKRDGYNFSGWYTSVDGGMKIDLNHVYTENTTLYAHWTLKKDDSDKDSDNTNTNDTDKETLYTVTFNMSGHGSDITRTNIKNDSLIIDKPDDPKTEGYTFTGWYKDSNCTVKWDFATDKVTSDTILYAGWAAKDSDTDQNDPFYTDAERISLKNAGAIANIKSRVYDGYEYEPAIKVTLTRNGKKTSLLEGADYTVTYKNNVNAGTATAVIKGCGMYKDDLTTNFSISRKSIKKLRVIAGSITGNTTGSSLSTLPVYIYDGSTLLEPSKDYTLSGYSTESQTAKVTVTGTGNYKDSRTVTFTLYADGTQNIIKPENIVLATKETSYTGNAISPEVKVTLNGITLTKNRDYKVQYQNQKNAGTAFAIITGKGAYKGKAIVPFQISAAKGTMIIKNIPAKTYNGKLQKPSITVTVPLNGKTVKLVQNKDYKISWKNNLRAGSNLAVAVVTGKGNYAGLTAEKKFTIKQQIISKAVISGTQGKLVLTYAGRILKEGLDYEKPVYEQGNKNKVKVTIKGKGSFKGETTKLVKIQ